MSIFEAESGALAEQPLRRPCATYRIQIHGEFRLDDVTRIVDYLHGLGISDCYLSPYLEARPGSTHGYDVFDHSRMSSEIGDDAAHERLLARLRELGMGRVIDIVPNHMGVAGANRSWLGMLETGPQAPSARFFDVDWDPVRGELHGRVLLPLLEDLYGKVLEAGLITLERDGGSFWIRYRDHRLPLHPRSYAHVLGRREAEFRERFEGESDDVAEYLSIRDSARHLPTRDELEPEKVEELGARRRSSSGGSPASAPRATGFASSSMPTWPPIGGTSGTPPASTRSTRSWRSRSTGSPTGESRPRRSTTAASST